MNRLGARRYGLACLLAAAVLAGGVWWPSSAMGLGPDSPEVKAAIDKAIEFLESDAANDQRIGARALVGLTLLKNGAEASHAKIAKAVKAIQGAAGSGDGSQITLDIYSTGLSIIFLVTLDPSKYHSEIGRLQASLKTRQKPHGGWGYPERATGDTSMTQYGVLSAWEAAQAGFAVPFDSIESVATWLLKTQDPSGGFGYQGIVSGTFVPVPQKEVKQALSAAGLGSLYICADMLGLSERLDRRDEDLPAALREVKPKGDAVKDAAKPQSKLDPRLFREAQTRGNRWLRTNHAIEPKNWTHYYLYALERYWSFRELAEGKYEKEPRWYSDHARILIRTQADDGSWQSRAGTTADTAFGALFLLRSTKKSIEKARRFASGTLVVGRGLPKDTAAVEVRMGRVVTATGASPAAELMAVLEDPDHADFDKAADAVAELPWREAEALVSKNADRLRRLSTHRSPATRAAAIRILALLRNLEHVPLLVRALGDSDPRVVEEARQALRYVSRRTSGPQPPEQNAADRRREEIDSWKTWYLAIRPEAEFDD